jgi:hypothetical protein
MRFADSTIWWRNSDSFFGVGPVVFQDKEWTYVLEDGYDCEKEKFEKAFLDSNVFLSRELPAGYHRPTGVNILFIYNLTLAKHNIGDVFKNEFMHWQQCGMLSVTYEDADSLATSIAASLNDFVDGKIDFIATDVFVVEDYPGSSPNQILQWREETCAKTQSLVPSDSSVPPNNNGQKKSESLFSIHEYLGGKIFVRNHEVLISKSLLGETYAIFDMNGKLVQKGIAGEIIRMPISPSILKIGAQKPILCK